MIPAFHILWTRHQIVEWFGLEGIFKTIQVSPPLPWTGLPAIRSGCPQPHPTRPWAPPGMGHPQLSSSQFPCLATPTARNFFLISDLNPPFCLKPSPLDLSLHLLTEHLLWVFTLWPLWATVRTPCSLLFLQAEHPPHLPQPILTAEMPSAHGKGKPSPSAPNLPIFSA